MPWILHRHLQNYQLLNCDDHANFLRKHKRDPALYRPDITHQVYLVGFSCLSFPSVTWFYFISLKLWGLFNEGLCRAQGMSHVVMFLTLAWLLSRLCWQFSTVPWTRQENWKGFMYIRRRMFLFRSIHTFAYRGRSRDFVDWWVSANVFVPAFTDTVSLLLEFFKVYVEVGDWLYLACL